MKISKKTLLEVGAVAGGAGLVKILLDRLWKREKEEIFCDFDGTITCVDAFPSVSEPADGVREALVKIQKKYNIVIYSCRTAKYWEKLVKGHKRTDQVQIIKDYMNKHNLPFDRIETRNDKPWGRIVDDKAIKFTDWNQVLKELKIK